MALTDLTRHILGKYKAACQTNKALASFEQYKPFQESQRERELTEETNAF